MIAYGPEEFEERDIHDPKEIKAFIGRYPVLWVNVNGLGDAKLIGQLGELFGLHRLALEDVVNTGQRAKMEDYDNHLFIVSRMATLDEQLLTEQISLFLGEKFVLTFQEHEGDCLDCIRERIRKATGRIRKAGPDYLAYTLLDTIIDHYFPVLEKYSEHLEIMEDQVIENPEKEMVSRIHQIKRELMTLRRAVWPQREMINSLMRESTPFIAADTHIYLRDGYDHVIQIIDMLENYRELASGLMDAYLSSVSNRMNEVMKVLTIFAAIFIPLTFIAGIYGMNFDPEVSPFNMPELKWFWGYPLALTLMAVMAITMLVYFYKKGWVGLLGSRTRKKKPDSELHH
jgi:magnesium transporter